LNNKFLRVLNIRADESALVSRLFIVQFFLIAGSSFLFVIANAIFLSIFPIKELPLVFFITGLCLFLFNKIYHRAEHLFSTRRMLFGVIIFSILITILIRFFMSFPGLTWMPYVLLVWYNVVYLLTGLVFWGLAASIFNVRESKRLFTIIGAGDVPAKLLGYLAVPLLGPFFGLSNLIWIVVILFAGAFWFSAKMLESSRIKDLSNQHENHHQHKKTKKQSANRLITAIALLSLLTFCALMLIDFIFLAEVKIKYHTDLELAYFIGLFFAGGRILAAIIKFTLSSRFINIAGLAGSLLISPIILFAFTIFLLASESVTGNHMLIYLFGFMALLTEILKTTIQEPVFLVLFQPLKRSLRLRGHVIAKGYMLATALTITGALLYLFVLRENLHSRNYLLYALMILLALWVISIFLVKKEYVLTLKDALQRGFLSGNDLFIEDKATIDLLLSKAKSNKSAEVIFSLDLLEKAGYKNLDKLLIEKLDSPDRAVTQFALEKISARKNNADVDTLIRKLRETKDPDFASQLIKAIAELTNGHPVLEEFINHKVPEIQRNAIVGMLQSNDTHLRKSAFLKIEEKVLLKQKESSIHSAQIIAKSGDPQFADTIRNLLNDPDEEVTRHAIEAAGKIRSPELLPVIIEKLKSPSLSKITLSAITNYKDDTIDYFDKYPSAASEKHIIKMAGIISTKKSLQFLQQLLFKNVTGQTQIIQQLYKAGFVASREFKENYYALARKRLDEAEKIFYLKNTFEFNEQTKNCIKALETEVNERLEDALKLLSIASANEQVATAIHAIISKQIEKLSNALEMLELNVARDIFQMINRLAEQKQRRKHAREEKPMVVILKDIIESKMIRYNDWTRAIAIKMTAGLDYEDFENFLNKQNFSLSPILAETRSFILSIPKN